MIDGYGGAKGRRVPLAAAANQANLNRKLLSEPLSCGSLSTTTGDWKVEPDPVARAVRCKNLGTRLKKPKEINEAARRPREQGERNIVIYYWANIV